MEKLQFQENNHLNLKDDGCFEIHLGDSAIICQNPDAAPYSLKYDSLQKEGQLIKVRYSCQEFDLLLEWTAQDDYLLLKPYLHKIKTAAIEKISILRNAAVKNIIKVLSHGYFSWDQSFLLSIEENIDNEGNGIQAFLNNKESIIIGFLEHDRMFQTFPCRSAGNQVIMDIDIYPEGKDLSGISSLELSEIVFFTHPDLDLGQKKWAELVAEKNRIQLDKPPTRGWCSWYYDYFWFSGDILEKHLEHFKPYKEDLNLNVFVIDANHFAHLGDWLDPDPKFHKGLEYYAGEIARAGYIPGIWIGPWMVADRSKLFREHKDWLVRDKQGELIEFMSPLGEDNVWGYRSKLHYCLDTSHPDAFEYLRQVFRTYRKWGFRYFKTDFMFWGSMDRFEGGWYHEGINAHNFIEDKSERPVIKRHTPGKNRIEYFIDVLKMIREEIGRDSIWLGCGQPIWASVGYVDCMRVSRDVGARWEAHNSPKELLNDLALRNFTNGRFYEVDPDCVLLRDWETRINETEATSLALYMGVAQGMILTSDYIHECKKQWLELFKFIQGDRQVMEFRPVLLGREEEIIIYSGTRKDNGLCAVFFFNNGENPVKKSYSGDLLEVKGTHAVRWNNEDQPFRISGNIDVNLEPHESMLLYIREEPFEKGWKPKNITG